MTRLLLSPQWLGWLALVVLLATACSALGLWQLDRRNDAADTIARIEANYERDPVPYEPGDFASFNPAREWIPVELTGVYDAVSQRVVRNRPLNGRPGYEVLVPLKLSDGTAVVINRGWLPIGNNDAGRPDSVPPPPVGEVTVTARIRPGEPAVARGAPQGQLASINLPAYRTELAYPVQTGAYGRMAAESPRPADTPTPFPKPSINEGPHLSYSMQWFAFGVLLFVGFGYAARQEYLAGTDRPVDVRAGTPDTRRRRPTAEQEEDAILDAQGFHGS